MRTLAFSLLLLGFTACSTNEPEANHVDDSTPAPNNIETRDYLAEGQTIAQTMFAALSGELKTALDQGGIPAAIPVCNIKAMAFTDSIGAANNVSIKRTAMRYRNPANAPTQHEIEMLEYYQQLSANGQQLTPIIDTLESGQLVFHGPILLAPLCAKCHGDVETDIGAEQYALIQEYYPEDLAIGFQPGELRGMWSIVFE